MTDRQTMIDAIAKHAELSAQDAEKAFRSLMVVGGIEYDDQDGYTVTFYGYMNREVLRRAALAQF